MSFQALRAAVCTTGLLPSKSRRAGLALRGETKDPLCQQGVDPLQVQLLKPIMMAPPRQMPVEYGTIERNGVPRLVLKLMLVQTFAMNHSLVPATYPAKEFRFLILRSPYGDARLVRWGRMQARCHGGIGPRGGTSRLGRCIR